ncbi:MAG: chondroitinase-B domain-containing protein [Pseudomonadota bacterium]
MKPSFVRNLLCRQPDWLTVCLLLALGGAGHAGVAVDSVTGLTDAIANAQPGDTITIAPGRYRIAATRISVNVPGTSTQPITVRAQALGQVQIVWDSAGSFVEGFLISAPWWRFENLDIEGICVNDSDCEHAFHVVGDADFTVIRNNRLHGFNAMLKANQTGGQFPDDVLVEGNELFNASSRNTANPVTPIDVVGGRRWILRSNTIYDFAKAGGNQISYAAFLKGNSKDGVIERNLVMCERFHSGQIRLGLSFGGGGSGPPGICEENTCTPEHEGGIMRNNLIINCPADVGIYLNEAADSEVHHNTLFNNTGIDVRFAASNVDLRNNLLMGQIRNRDQGVSSEQGNLENVSLTDMRAWFVDPDNADFALLDGSAFLDQGQPVLSVPEDFCGRPRDDGAPDLGALEYGGLSLCITSAGGGLGDQVFRDGFE